MKDADSVVTPSYAFQDSEVQLQVDKLQPIHGTVGILRTVYESKAARNNNYVFAMPSDPV